MNKLSDGNIQQCTLSHSSVSFILQRAITASDNIHQELADDVSIIFHNALQTIHNIGSYPLDKDYEKELLCLKEELHSELKELLKALTNEYLQHKYLLDSLYKRLHNPSICSDSHRDLSIADLEQTQNTFINQQINDSNLSINGSQSNHQLVITTAETIIRELMLQHASSSSFDFNELKFWHKRNDFSTVLSLIDRLTLYQNDIELALSQATTLLSLPITSIDDFHLSFKLLTTQLDRDIFALNNSKLLHLSENHNTDETELFFSLVLYLINEVASRISEINNQIELLCSIDIISKNKQIIDLEMKIQALQVDIVQSPISQSEFYDLESQLECRKAELLIEAHKQVSTLLMEKNEYVQDLNRLLSILTSFLQGTKSVCNFAPNESLLSRLISSKLSSYKSKLEKQLSTCSTSSLRLKILVVLYAMNYSGYSSSLDLLSTPLESYDSQLIEQEYLSAHEYLLTMQLCGNNDDNITKSMLVRLIDELSKGIQNSKQLLNSISLDMCIPDEISNNIKQYIEFLHPLQESKYVSELDLVENPIKILYFEECASLLPDYSYINKTKVDKLIEDLQVLILNFVPRQESSLLSIEQYSKSVYDRIQLFKVIWNHLLEIVDRKKHTMKNVRHSLSIFINEMFNAVAESSQKLTSIAEDALLLVLKFFLDSLLTETNLQETILVKLNHDLEVFETKCMQISCRIQLESLGESLLMESFLDKLIKDTQDKSNDIIITRDCSSFIWTRQSRFWEEPNRFKNNIQSLHMEHNYHYSIVESVIKHSITSNTVRVVLLNMLNMLKPQLSTNVSLSNNDLHISGLNIDYSNSHLTTSTNNNVTRTSDTQNTLLPSSFTSNISSTSSLACKIATDVIAPDAYAKGYVSTLQMSRYIKSSNCSQSQLKQKSILSLTNTSVHKLVVSNQSKKLEGLSRQCTMEPRNLTKTGAIHYFDNNYKNLYVIKTLASMQKPDIQMLEYIFGYMKYPCEVLYWTSQMTHPSNCTIHMSINIQDLLIKHREKTICSISSRSIIAVTNNPIKTHFMDDIIYLFPLIISAKTREDLMILFNEERDAVVFKIGLQTIIRHRKNLPRLIAASQCE